jgi:hypothetical protein
MSQNNPTSLSSVCEQSATQASFQNERRNATRRMYQKEYTTHAILWYILLHECQPVKV